MPAVRKCRRVCAEPSCTKFMPDNGNQETLSLTVEELEALRLCDLESLDQDAAAARMDVSRGTLQRMLYSARRTTAKALTFGLGIQIGGGHYEISGQGCDCRKLCKNCKFK